jgi:hypothetical protein
MAGRLTVSATLALTLLGTSAGWAMQTITAPVNKDVGSRFSDSANQSQKRTSGSVQTFGSFSGGAFGAGGSGSVSLGTPRYPTQTAPSTPFPNPAFSDSNNPAFSNFPTYGAAIDPTFGPNGEYAPRFNNKR